MAEFVHLHVHSDFSLKDSSASVMGLADRAEELGMTHLAITDHGNMFGAMEFMSACEETIKIVNGKDQHKKRDNPIKPIIGCEVYVAPGSRLDKKGSEKDAKYYHLVLLAANREGYFNLVKLCSYAYTDGYYHRPRVDDELLARYHGGLIALSACVSGEIPRLIQAGKPDEAEKKALFYRDLFGTDKNGAPNFYLEMQDHGIPADVLKNSPLSQKEIYRAVAGISRKTGIPLVATNDVHYLRQDDFIAHDILLCIGTAKLRSETDRKKYFGEQYYLKSQDEMAALFSEYPEAITNTVLIANRCAADIIQVDTKDLSKYLPIYEIPKEYENADAYMTGLTWEGIAERYTKEKREGAEKWKAIQERTQYELDTITQMGFSGYFLIVADFINWARNHNISVGPGRGSGAGSIVAYALKIIDIDPLKYKLLFERFLNPERISMPDFDVDFAKEGRDDVLNYVAEKYGRDRVGQIITFGTLGAKAVIKDVARVLGIGIPESDMITKLIPNNPKITLAKSLDEEPRLQELRDDPRYTELFKLAFKLEGLHRHSSIHASGVVIGREDLINLVPLYRDIKTGSVATQYSMNFLEKCGLVKMDFLGLKTLDAIKHTVELIRLKGGEYASFNVQDIPENDEATFNMLGEGKSFELFQFESDGMQNILKRAKPNSIEDLIALNSLYRPGPMDNIDQFVESKNGRQEIVYPDPSLEDVLKETYGVIVYQEQVMQVARIVAGFSLGHADELRRAMGKKNLEKMEKEKVKFIAGAKERGYSEKKADEIFELLIPFAGYGFNKSHAAGYSVVAYQTAYLKANFPIEFMTANLTNEIHAQDKNKLSECINEARKMNLAIDPPDINNSVKYFSVKNGHIAYGLLGIKNVGDVPLDEIINCRKDGPYKNFMDFLDRVNFKMVGKSDIEHLVKSGAFDCFGVRRENLVGNLERAVEYAQKKKGDKLLGQSSLFEDLTETDFPNFVFEEFPAMSRTEWLNIEKQLIGFYFSGHPLDEYKEVWQRAVRADLGEPEKLKTGSCILVGIVTSVKVVSTKNGKMAFATLADFNGEIELTFFSRAWEKLNSRIEIDKVVALKGKLDYQKEKDKHSFIADDLLDLSEIDAALSEEEEQERNNSVFHNTWEYMADLKSGSIVGAEKGSYTVMGFLKNLREHQDSKGNGMAFGTLHDFEGEIDLVFFSKVWDECRALLKLDEFVALKGNIDPERDKDRKKPGFKVSSIADLAMYTRTAARKASAGEAPPESKTSVVQKKASAPPESPALRESKGTSAAAPQAIHISLKRDAIDRDEMLHPLRDYLSQNPGSCPVFIHIPVSGSEKIVRTTTGIGTSDGEALAMLNSCAVVSRAWKE
jgi:DNA polymerase-3 subunit alpha